MNRRDFIKTTGTAIAGASLLSTGATAAEKRAMKKALMIGGPSGDLVAKFKEYKAAGLDGVEPNSHLDQAEVLKARDTSGLAIPSVCDSIHWAKTLTDPNPSVRAEGLDGLKQALRDAKAYGASSVLLVPGVVNDKVNYRDAWTRSQAEIRKAIPLAEELGVVIAIENVWNNFLLSPVEAAEYVDDFKTPMVGWHFDIGNIGRYGWAEQWIPVLGKRIAKLHFKEFSKKKMEKEGLWAGFNVDYLEGDNNWAAIMAAADAAGYTTWAIAEPAFTPKDVAPTARLRQITEKLGLILAS